MAFMFALYYIITEAMLLLISINPTTYTYAFIDLITYTYINSSFGVFWLYIICSAFMWFCHNVTRQTI